LKDQSEDIVSKIWIIIRKEWSEVFKNRFVLYTVAFLPLVLTAIPIVILYSMGSAGDAGSIGMGDIPGDISELCPGMTGGECSQYYLVSQFMLLFMMIPLMIPVTIASYSIVGEKATRTLEPLLATPISTLQLLAGKGLAAVIPAALASWGGFAIFSVAAHFIASGPAVSARLVDPLWLVAIFVVGPLMSIAAVCVAVMISSRVNDPRAAEQLSMLLVIPLLALFFGRIAGFVLINEALIMWMAVALALIDAGLVALALHLFQRDTILTRWK
jgi:ABC-2 type transport system permease protein